MASTNADIEDNGPPMTIQQRIAALKLQQGNPGSNSTPTTTSPVLNKPAPPVVPKKKPAIPPPSPAQPVTPKFKVTVNTTGSLSPSPVDSNGNDTSSNANQHVPVRPARPTVLARAASIAAPTQQQLVRPGGQPLIEDADDLAPALPARPGQLTPNSAQKPPRLPPRTPSTEVVPTGYNSLSPSMASRKSLGRRDSQESVSSVFTTNSVATSKSRLSVASTSTTGRTVSRPLKAPAWQSGHSENTKAEHGFVSERNGSRSPARNGEDKSDRREARPALPTRKTADAMALVRRHSDEDEAPPMLPARPRPQGGAPHLDRPPPQPPRPGQERLPPLPTRPTSNAKPEMAIALIDREVPPPMPKRPDASTNGKKDVRSMGFGGSSMNTNKLTQSLADKASGMAADHATGLAKQSANNYAKQYGGEGAANKLNGFMNSNAGKIMESKANGFARDAAKQKINSQLNQNRGNEVQDGPPDLSKIMASKPKPTTAQEPSSMELTVAQPEPIDEDDERCYKCWDFSGPDNHAAQFPRETVPSIAWLGKQLVAPFDNDTDRARAIFTWMHHNIDYDVVGFANGTAKMLSPEEVLREGLSVCAGYSGLFNAIALQAGMECLVISGFGSGFGIEKGAPNPKKLTNHAWNAIKIDGTWKLVDPTWGAGHIQGLDKPYVRKFNPAEFTMSNIMFGIKHLPSDPAMQFREDGRTISTQEYFFPTEEVHEHVFSCNRDWATEEGIDWAELIPGGKDISLSKAHENADTVRFQFNRPCTHWRLEKHGNGLKPYCFWILPNIKGQDRQDFIFVKSDGYYWWADVPIEKLGGPGSSVMIGCFDTFDHKPGRGMTRNQYRKNTMWSSKSLAQWAIVA